MSRLHRLHRPVIAPVMAIALAVPVPRAPHAPTPAVASMPLVQFHAGIRNCYLPAQVSLAERRLSPQPVDPTASVAVLLCLPLRQVIVLSGTAAGARGPARAIVYVFGTPPDPTQDRVAALPNIIAQETVGRTSAVGEQPTYIPGTWPGPWQFDATIPGRNLSLHLSADVGKDGVRAVGERIAHIATYPLDDVPAYPGNRYDTPVSPPMVTQGQAIVRARLRVGAMATHVAAVFAHYVLYTNVTYERLPVWVVTFEGITQASHGRGPTRFHHELNVVIDARTGQDLDAFSER